MESTPVPSNAEAVAGPPAGSEQSAKGLSSGALGLFASVVIGIASVAPAYSLAATVGILVAIKGIGMSRVRRSFLHRGLCPGAAA